MSVSRIERTFQLLFEVQSLSEVLQVSQKLSCRLITLVSIFAERFLNDPFQLRWHLRPVSRQRNRFSTKDCHQHVGVGWSCKGRTTCQHFVKDHTEAPNVRTRIDTKPTRLLRRHVRSSSHHYSRLCLKQHGTFKNCWFPFG